MHRAMTYDLEVDTAVLDPTACAHAVLARIGSDALPAAMAALAADRPADPRET